MTITEYKHNLSKPDEVFACNLIHRETGYVVLRYDVTEDQHIRDIPIPAGSHTIAHYRQNVGFVLWEMHGPDGTLLGRLFHLCEGPIIAGHSVHYTDLLLDLWFAPDGTVRELDRDEVEDALAAGQLAARQLLALERTAVRIRADYETNFQRTRR
jgi:hypothetical protein